MKRYGYNWLMLWTGMMLCLGIPIIWLRYTGEVFWPSSKPLEVSDFILFGMNLANGWTVMFFLAMRKTYHKRLEMQKMGEGQSSTTVESATKAKKQLKPVPIKNQLLGIIGAVSAVVGPVMAATHFLNPQVSVASILSCALGIPLCCAVGTWLVEKANLKEQQNQTPVPIPVGRVHGMPAYAPPVKVTTTDEEHTMLKKHLG